MTNIYCLKDPATDEVCYVGQTVGPIEKRLRAHVLSSRQETSKKSLWIQALTSKGMTPCIETIEQCPDDQANEREYHWIMHHYSINPALTNGTVGDRRPRRVPTSGRCPIKGANLQIHVTPEQRETIRKLAQDYGKSTTELILLMAKYVKDKRPTFQIKPVKSKTESQ